ncbi:MAG: hypothetical protein AB7E72_01485 [Lysobacterales bacterium]
MTKDEDHCVFLATDEELGDIQYYLRLWIAARNITIGRRSWLDEIANTLRDYHGTIWASDGETYAIPLVDEVFGDDPDMRWMSDYLRPSDQDCERPARISSLPTRVRLIDLYFRIKHPEIARHFKRREPGSV